MQNVPCGLQVRGVDKTGKMVKRHSLISITDFLCIHPTCKEQYQSGYRHEEEASGEVRVEHDLCVIGIDIGKHFLQHESVRQGKERGV